MADALQQRQNLFGELELEQCIVARHHLGFAAAFDQNARTRLR